LLIIKAVIIGMLFAFPNYLAATRLPDKDIRDGSIESWDLTGAQMTPAQIAAAQKLECEWKPKK
jgi:ABC-type transport system involved in cytochrome c biogenesis permease component